MPPASKPTRDRVLNAAFETLCSEGFSGTSARAISARGGFTPGVIYYHFDDIEDVFLAVLERISAARLVSYREALEKAATFAELIKVLSDLYEDDMNSGHVAAVQEIVAGASSSPELGQQIVQRLEPWFQLAASVTSRIAAPTPFARLIPAEDIGYAAVALYLGLETVTHLDGDRSRARRLFASASVIAPLADLLATAWATGMPE
jgi:AcrR family transcriptional regulator